MKRISAANTRSLFSLLGIARKAGLLMIGQDQIRAALSAGKKLLLLATGDCSENVMSRLTAGAERGSELLLIQSGSRDDLGHALGIQSAQVVALPLRCDFANKILTFSSGEADIDE